MVVSSFEDWFKNLDPQFVHFMFNIYAGIPAPATHITVIYDFGKFTAPLPTIAKELDQITTDDIIDFHTHLTKHGLQKLNGN